MTRVSVVLRRTVCGDNVWCCCQNSQRVLLRTTLTRMIIIYVLIIVLRVECRRFYHQFSRMSLLFWRIQDRPTSTELTRLTTRLENLSDTQLIRISVASIEIFSFLSSESRKSWELVPNLLERNSATHWHKPTGLQACYGNRSSRINWPNRWKP